MNNFFQENGRLHLIFFYGEADTNDQAKSVIINNATPQNQAFKPAPRPTKSKVQIVEGSDIPLKGICIFFIRVTAESTVTAATISQVI